MVDKDLILAKAGSIKRRLKRVEEKSNIELKAFLNDIDLQESILFNLQISIQNCIDIAAHIISDEGLGVPGSASEMFYLLEENGYLDNTITEKIIRAVGFRNLIFHEYEKIAFDQVFEVAVKNIKDLNEYLQSIFNRIGLIQTDT